MKDRERGRDMRREYPRPQYQSYPQTPRDRPTQEVGCQYDIRPDNICTCRNGRVRRPEVGYFGFPKQIYAYHGTRSFTDIGVGSVKALMRKKVKKIYLPSTNDRGVGSSDLTSVILRKTRQRETTREVGYYDHKRTSSKCVGGIIEYNTGCVLSKKLSPIIQTRSGTTSPIEPSRNKNQEIGSSTVINNVFTKTTQVNTEVNDKATVHNSIITDAVNNSSIKEDLKASKQSRYKKPKFVNLTKSIDTKAKEPDKDYSSDSLEQHVHNLEVPSEEKPSHTSVDPMENKLEKEYRRIFSTRSKDEKSSKEERPSKEDKPKSSRTSSEIKSVSVFKRRFEALRRGVAKKEDSKRNAALVIKASSQISAASHKDVSIVSDPPSLESRSYSNTKPFSPFTSIVGHDRNFDRRTMYRDSVSSGKEKSSLPTDGEDSESQGVKGMFKLWGKKFNLEEDYQEETMPMPSISISKKSVHKAEIPTTSKYVEEKKESKKFFFFKKKSKDKTKPYKPKKGVTTGRCEVKDGLTIKIGGTNQPAMIKESIPEVLEDYDEIVRKAWLKKYLTQTIESRNSVKIRWNNKTYATSSSTVFELMDNVYKEAGVILKSKSEMTISDSYYQSYTRQQVNFLYQNIEAWMIPKTIPDSPKDLPIQINFKSSGQEKDNIEIRISDQKWFIDKSKAFSHKIEVVLHSKNFVQKKQSSEYLRIDIPKGFFVDSSSDDKRTQSSDEQVYNIVEYETGSEIKKNRLAQGLSTGDNKYNNIEVTVNVKTSQDKEPDTLETVIKNPAMHRDVVIQGSNVYIPKRCDVIGVGIITQRDLREIKKPILKIRDDVSDEESEPVFRSNHKKSKFAESYLQDYYRQWTPLGMDFYSWCVSDSHLGCCSENSKSTFNNQVEGTRSCPNILDDFQPPTVVSSCDTSSCSHFVAYVDDDKTKDNFGSKLISKLMNKDKKADDGPSRVLPKDSIEVFKRRKIYALSNKSRWSCATDEPYSVPSNESRGAQNYSNECPKVMKPCCKPLESKPKKTGCKKHVSMPDCDAINKSFVKELGDGIPGILSKGSAGCPACKEPGSPKNAVINSGCPTVIPQAPCKTSCEKLKEPPCSGVSTSSPRQKRSPIGGEPCDPSCPLNKTPSPPCTPTKKPSPPPKRICSPPERLSPALKKPSPPAMKPCVPGCPSANHSSPATKKPSPPAKKPCPPKCPSAEKPDNIFPPGIKLSTPARRPAGSQSSPCKAGSPASSTGKTSPTGSGCSPCKPKSAKPSPTGSGQCKSGSRKPSPTNSGQCKSGSRKPSPAGSNHCKSGSRKPSPAGSGHCKSGSRKPSPAGSAQCKSGSRQPSPAGSAQCKSGSRQPSPAGSGQCKSGSRKPSPTGSGQCKSGSPKPIPSGPGPCKSGSSPLRSPGKTSPIGSSSSPCKTCSSSGAKAECSQKTSLITKCSKSPPKSGDSSPPCNSGPRRKRPCPRKQASQLANPATPNTPPKGSQQCCSPKCKGVKPELCPRRTPDRIPSPAKAGEALRPVCKKSSGSNPKLPGPQEVTPGNTPKSSHSCTQKKAGLNFLPCTKLFEKFKKKTSKPKNETVDTPPATECAPKRRMSCGPCQGCNSDNKEFPWPIKNQVSNQSLLQKCVSAPNTNINDCKEKSPYSPKVSAHSLIKIEGMRGCEQASRTCQGPPCVTPKVPSCPVRPPVKVDSPCQVALPTSSKSKLSGIWLKMKPFKKKSSKDTTDKCAEYGCIRLSSKENLTIRMKAQTPSTEEIRVVGDDMNVKVQDEDGQTLYERRDYRENCPREQHRPSVLGDMYRTSNVIHSIHRISAQVIGDITSNKPDNNAKEKSDASLTNMIEIQFQMKVTQGDKTTEIGIAKEDDDKAGKKTFKQPEEVFVVKNDSVHSIESKDPKNDINIRIVIKNFKPKSDKKKSKCYHEEFSREISDKFHTVSTGYSDKFCNENAENVFSVHRATVDLTTSGNKLRTEDLQGCEVNVLKSVYSTKLKDNVDDSESNVTNNQHSSDKDGNKISEKGDLNITQDPAEIDLVKKDTTENYTTDNDDTERSETQKPSDFARRNYLSDKYDYTDIDTEKDELTDKNDLTERDDLTEKDDLTDRNYWTEREDVTERDDLTDKDELTEKEDFTEKEDLTEKDNLTEKEDLNQTDGDAKKQDKEKGSAHRTPEVKYVEVQEQKSFQQNYEAPISTDTDEQDLILEANTSTDNDTAGSIEVIIKPHTREEKKEMLKEVFEKAHATKVKSKTRMRKLRDMLKSILTSDSSGHDELKINELAEDLTYESLKPNYFRDTDSMNNYYNVGPLSDKGSAVPVMYPTQEKNSECSKSSDELSSEEESPHKECMCNTLAARLNLCQTTGGGCCCKPAKKVKPVKKDEEIVCDIKTDDVCNCNINYVDVETQHSKYYYKNNTSLHSYTKSSIIETCNIVKVDEIPGKSDTKKERKSLKRSFSPYISHIKECPMKKFNRHTILTISDDDKIVMNHNKVKNDSKDSNIANDPAIRTSDILQSYEAKKAVLEIYAEKTVSENGEHFVAKLPKFVYDRENEIVMNYEAIAANNYTSLCKRNVIMMSIKR